MNPTRNASQRPYAGEADLDALQQLLLPIPDPFEQYPAAADLPRLLDPAVSDTTGNTLVWEDARGEIVGFASVDARFRNLYYRFRPGALTDEAERELMAWALERMRVIAASSAGPVTLDAAARDDDPERVAFLRRHGFAPGPDRTLSMARSLSVPIPEPVPPPGFDIRPLAGEGEVEAYVEAHRAAYGTENMTVEDRLATMREPGYRPELDLVVVAPDGGIAAFCVCFVDEEENVRRGRREGEIGIVGVQPEYRGRGFGRAAVLAALRAIKARGLETAVLGVASGNAAAIRAYESAGFGPRWSTRWYAKPVG